MPSHLHESLVKLLRGQPAFAKELLRTVLGVDLRSTPRLRQGSENFSEIKPPEFRADAVYEVRNEVDRVERVIIFEVQLDWKRQRRRGRGYRPCGAGGFGETRRRTRLVVR